MAFPRIATKTGDGGTTALWSGERVPKTDPRVRAVGEIDLALSALGRCHRFVSGDAEFDRTLRDGFLHLQRRFTQLMGEISCSNEAKERYRERNDGITVADVDRADEFCEQVRGELDRLGVEMGHWRVYGEGGEASAEFYFARGLFRQCELSVWELRERGFTVREEILQLLNRVGDLLFLVAVLKEADISSGGGTDAE